MLLMFRYGLREIWTDQHRLKLLVLYLLAALTFSIVRPWDIAYSGPDMFDAISRIAFILCFPILVFGGLAVLIIWAGTPSKAKSIQNNLQRIGLVNHAGEVPLLVAVRQDETDDAHSNITVLEFRLRRPQIRMGTEKRGYRNRAECPCRIYSGVRRLAPHPAVYCS